MPKGRVNPIYIPCCFCNVIFLKEKPGKKHCSDVCRKKNSYKLKQQKRNYNKYDWKYSLNYNYGITPEQYLKMVNDSENKCNICGIQPTKRLFVDHCHETGRIRGLLCTKCNTGLGMFKDKLELLESAQDYLRKGIK